MAARATNLNLQLTFLQLAYLIYSCRHVYPSASLLIGVSTCWRIYRWLICSLAYLTVGINAVGVFTVDIFAIGDIAWKQFPQSWLPTLQLRYLTTVCKTHIYSVRGSHIYLTATTIVALPIAGSER